VVIDANGMVFAQGTRGFTITNSRREEVLLGGETSDVKVEGNVATSNGTNGNDAFVIQGAKHTVVGNWASNNARGGFTIAGSDVIVISNWASSNLQGVDLIAASGRFARNVIVGNRLDGLVVNAPRKDLVIRRNDILNNGQHGVPMGPFDGIMTQNNIFGNAILGNCGLLNQSGGVVNAPRNFWGTASGPGPDSADAVCDDLGSVTVVEPVATKEFSIPDLAEVDD